MGDFGWDTPEKFYKWLVVLCFAIAMGGALILNLAPKDDSGMKKRALFGFSTGLVFLGVLFLIKNPDIVEWAHEHIALTLIGMVIAFFSVFKKFIK